MSIRNKFRSFIQRASFKDFRTLKNRLVVFAEPVLARLEELGFSGLVAVFTVFVLLFSALLMTSIFSAVLPVREVGGEQIVVIEKGLSTAEIAQILEEEGIIRSAEVFRLFARLKGIQGTLKAGTYLLSPAQNMWEIMEVINSGESLSEDIQVTIPEGLTVPEIARLLAERGLVEEEDFLRSARLTWDEYPFVAHKRPDVVYPVEGYLFPDTYRFSTDVTAEKIIRRMLDRFLEVVVEGKKEALEAQDLSLHEVITLASIVEREAMLDEERPIISRVFLNRLKYGLPLQSCPTVEYALGERKGILTNEDLEVDSPYNTYKYTGLPPGPIGSPGISSIDAVLDPGDVDYLYFVATGNGDHLFARTYEGHLQNIRRVRTQR